MQKNQQYYPPTARSVHLRGGEIPTDMPGDSFPNSQQMRPNLRGSQHSALASEANSRHTEVANGGRRVLRPPGPRLSNTVEPVQPADDSSSDSAGSGGAPSQAGDLSNDDKDTIRSYPHARRQQYPAQTPPPTTNHQPDIHPTVSVIQAWSDASGQVIRTGFHFQNPYSNDTDNAFLLSRIAELMPLLDQDMVNEYNVFRGKPQHIQSRYCEDHPESYLTKMLSLGCIAENNTQSKFDDSQQPHEPGHATRPESGYMRETEPPTAAATLASSPAGKNNDIHVHFPDGHGNPRRLIFEFGDQSHGSSGARPGSESRDDARGPQGDRVQYSHVPSAEWRQNESGRLHDSRRPDEVTWDPYLGPPNPSSSIRRASYGVLMGHTSGATGRPYHFDGSRGPPAGQDAYPSPRALPGTAHWVENTGPTSQRRSDATFNPTQPREPSSQHHIGAMRLASGSRIRSNMPSNGDTRE